MTANLGRLVASGPAAAILGLQLMSKAKPFVLPAAGGTGAPVWVYPSQRFADGSVMIGKADGIHVYVANGGSIYESPASTFLSRTLLLNDVSARMQRSMWLATLGEAELEFIFVTCATLVGTLGTAVAIGEFVCEVADKYYEHKHDVDLIAANLRPIVATLVAIRVLCPTLFNYLVRAFLGTAANAADRAWQGVTLKDVAYFAGKFAAYAIKSRGNFALGLTEAVKWTALIRSAGIGSRSLVAEAEKLAQRLRALGHSAIGREQLMNLANDACLSKAEVQALLRGLSVQVDVVVRGLGPFLLVVSVKA